MTLTLILRCSLSHFWTRSLHSSISDSRWLPATFMPMPFRGVAHSTSPVGASAICSPDSSPKIPRSSSSKSRSSSSMSFFFRSLGSFRSLGLLRRLLFRWDGDMRDEPKPLVDDDPPNNLAT